PQPGRQLQLPGRIQANKPDSDRKSRTKMEEQIWFFSQCSSDGESSPRAGSWEKFSTSGLTTVRSSSTPSYLTWSSSSSSPSSLLGSSPWPPGASSSSPTADPAVPDVNRRSRPSPASSAPR